MTSLYPRYQLRRENVERMRTNHTTPRSTVNITKSFLHNVKEKSKPPLASVKLSLTLARLVVQVFARLKAVVIARTLLALSEPDCHTTQLHLKPWAVCSHRDASMPTSTTPRKSPQRMESLYTAEQNTNPFVVDVRACGRGQSPPHLNVYVRVRLLFLRPKRPQTLTNSRLHCSSQCFWPVAVRRGRVV